jgi:hypothetical protein
MLLLSRCWAVGFGVGDRWRKRWLCSFHGLLWHVKVFLWCGIDAYWRDWNQFSMLLWG